MSLHRAAVGSPAYPQTGSDGDAAAQAEHDQEAAGESPLKGNDLFLLSCRI